MLPCGMRRLRAGWVGVVLDITGRFPQVRFLVGIVTGGRAAIGDRAESTLYDHSMRAFWGALGGSVSGVFTSAAWNRTLILL